MRLTLEACCGCHMGNIRKNNEDNFLFNRQYMESDNTGLEVPLVWKTSVKNGLWMAVFDGMGGENFGEEASCAAAKTLQEKKRNLRDLFTPDDQYLHQLCMQLNDAVVAAKEALDTDRMGTTMVGLYFTSKEAYMCNIGDSRAYLCRDEALRQISVDHAQKASETSRRKPPLTQHLGIDPAYMQIEPYITKNVLQPGDQYLLCSDGLTDMLTDGEIADILSSSQSAENCVQALLQAALDRGGRDNVTVIVCKIME